MLERRGILDNLSSVKMRRIAGLSRHSARLKSSLIHIEGAQVLREALRFALDSVEDVYLAEAAGVSEPELLSLVEAAPVHGHWVSERVARVMAEAAQDWLATASFAVLPPFHELWGRVALILPETQNLSNVGTILRLVDTCGTSSVSVGEQSADMSSPKAIRASVGSMLYVPTPCFSDLVQLVSTLHGSWWLVAGTALDAPLAWDFEAASQFADKRVAWMTGNEAHGPDAAQRESYGALMAIPMFRQAESFNVSQAATLVLWMTTHAQAR